jgi:hypothetical protein
VDEHGADEIARNIHSRAAKEGQLRRHRGAKDLWKRGYRLRHAMTMIAGAVGHERDVPARYTSKS